VLDRIVYLNRGLAVICAFIGAKLLLQALRASGAAWAPTVPPWLSLAVIGTVPLITVTAGAVNSRRTAGRPAENPPDAAPRPDGMARASSERDVLLQRFAVFDIDGNDVWQRADYEQLTRRSWCAGCQNGSAGSAARRRGPGVSAETPAGSRTAFRSLSAGGSVPVMARAPAWMMTWQVSGLSAVAARALR